MSRTPKLRSDRLELRKLETDDADGRREERSEATAAFDEGPRPRARLGGQRVAARILAEGAGRVDGHLGCGARPR